MNFILEQYNKQIKKEINIYKKKELCLSYWNKLLFIESINLNIKDWQIIRTNNYWSIRDNFFVKDLKDETSIKNEILRIKFILNNINNYKNQKTK
jgi:hypothetical protein